MGNIPSGADLIPKVQRPSGIDASNSVLRNAADRRWADKMGDTQFKFQAIQTGLSLAGQAVGAIGSFAARSEAKAARAEGAAKRTGALEAAEAIATVVQNVAVATGGALKAPAPGADPDAPPLREFTRASPEVFKEMRDAVLNNPVYKGNPRQLIQALGIIDRGAEANIREARTDDQWAQLQAVEEVRKSFSSNIEYLNEIDKKVVSGDQITNAEISTAEAYIERLTDIIDSADNLTPEMSSAMVRDIHRYTLMLARVDSGMKAGEQDFLNNKRSQQTIGIINDAVDLNTGSLSGDALARKTAQTVRDHFSGIAGESISDPLRLRKQKENQEGITELLESTVESLRADKKLGLLKEFLNAEWTKDHIDPSYRKSVLRQIAISATNSYEAASKEATEKFVTMTRLFNSKRVLAAAEQGTIPLPVQMELADDYIKLVHYMQENAALISTKHGLPKITDTLKRITLLNYATSPLLITDISASDGEDIATPSPPRERLGKVYQALSTQLGLDDYPERLAQSIHRDAQTLNKTPQAVIADMFGIVDPRMKALVDSFFTAQRTGTTSSTTSFRSDEAFRAIFSYGNIDRESPEALLLYDLLNIGIETDFSGTGDLSDSQDYFPGQRTSVLERETGSEYRTMDEATAAFLSLLARGVKRASKTDSSWRDQLENP